MPFTNLTCESSKLRPTKLNTWNGPDLVNEAHRPVHPGKHTAAPYTICQQQLINKSMKRHQNFNMSLFIFYIKKIVVLKMYL